MISNLAYVGFTSPAADEWRTFGPEILGTEVVPSDDGVVRLRIDDKAWRIAIHPGEVDDVAYVGWEVADAELAPMRDRAEGFGCSVHDDGGGLAGQRRVGRISWFEDPFGFRHELVDTVEGGHTFTPGRPLVGSFVTGEQGLGHIVFIVADGEQGQRLATDVLGMKPSDTVSVGGLDVKFYHCAGEQSRHHTMAMVGFPGMVGVFHMMLELSDIDDVGTALDLVKDRDLPLPMDLGRHPNDLMTSFYVRGPSGFDIEYGTGGRVVDDTNWEIGSYDRASLWGHRPPAGGPPPPGILRPLTTGGSRS